MNGRQRGKRFETSLCSDIYQETDKQLFPEPIGFSGNHAVPAPDVRIDDGTKVHAIELKTTKNDRISIEYDEDNTKRDDLWQLLDYAERFPRTVVPYVGVRFNNRQLLLMKIWIGAPNVRSKLQSAVNSVPTDVRLTNSNNLSVHKPSLDDWPSAKGGDDAVHTLEKISWKDYK